MRKSNGASKEFSDLIGIVEDHVAWADRPGTIYAAGVGKSGLSSAEVAKAIGCAPLMIEMIRDGSVEPSVDFMIRMLRVNDKTLSDIPIHTLHPAPLPVIDAVFEFIKASPPFSKKAQAFLTQELNKPRMLGSMQAVHAGVDGHWAGYTHGAMFKAALDYARGTFDLSPHHGAAMFPEATTLPVAEIEKLYDDLVQRFVVRLSQNYLYLETKLDGLDHERDEQRRQVLKYARALNYLNPNEGHKRTKTDKQPEQLHEAYARFAASKRPLELRRIVRNRPELIHPCLAPARVERAVATDEYGQAVGGQDLLRLFVESYARYWDVQAQRSVTLRSAHNAREDVRIYEAWSHTDEARMLIQAEAQAASIRGRKSDLDHSIAARIRKSDQPLASAVVIPARRDMRPS